MIGQRLGPYEITARLGEGGMGVVWKALDTTLKREVAIKILPAGFAGDPERLARFEREARLLASLSHPNIAGIYGLHEIPSPGRGEESLRFIAMELVHGEDLAVRLQRGKPQKLFSPSLRRDYFDVSADGQRFLLVERIDPDIRSITLIQNWAATPSTD